MTTKELMKQFNVQERTIRRWVENDCPHTITTQEGTNRKRLEFDIEAVAKWRQDQWTREK